MTGCGNMNRMLHHMANSLYGAMQAWVNKHDTFIAGSGDRSRDY
jgi:hypothetical protein